MLDQDHVAPQAAGPPVRHPRASLQRQRAAGLRHVASEIEADVIGRLEHLSMLARLDVTDSPRGRLCVAMLERHLDQLHDVVDELREIAFRSATDAEQLDLQWRSPTRR